MPWESILNEVFLRLAIEVPKSSFPGVLLQLAMTEIHIPHDEKLGTFGSGEFHKIILGFLGSFFMLYFP